MKICEGWRRFYVPPEGYKLDNEVKPVVEQSFVHNLNSWINQVSTWGKSLVPIPTTPSVPPPIPPFITIYYSRARQYFGYQGTRQQRLDNSLSSVSINGRTYNGHVYDDKIKCLTRKLFPYAANFFLEVTWNSTNKGSLSTRILAFFK